MSSGHTPGPWHIHDQDDGLAIVLDGPVDLEICSVSTRRKEADANARLIAAAPDLLALLTKICDRSAGPFETSAIPLSKVPSALIDEARAAIKKTRGAK